VRAIVYESYGGPEVLELREVRKPVPGAKDLLIRVRAVEVTKSDCEMRSFRYPVSWFWLPMRIAMGIRKPRRPVLGFYFAGEVAEVGNEVSGFSVGDQVFGSSNFRLGAYAEYLRVPASFAIIGKPANMSFNEAAAVPLGGWNALHFSGNPTLATMLRCAITNRFTDKRASFAFAKETREALTELKAMIESGQLGAIVDTVLPLAEAADAHRRVESEERLGAVVLEVS
jgi:NADPH:quinone reductase-like Zn-dependent oxidoreductase